MIEDPLESIVYNWISRWFLFYPGNAPRLINDNDQNFQNRKRRAHVQLNARGSFWG